MVVPDGSLTVTLTEAQVSYARKHAQLRERGARGRPQARGASDDPARSLEIHIVGAEGETAFGVWLYGTAPGDGWGLTLNTYSGPPDFPPRTEVRARGTARYGREPADLKIHRGEEHGEMSARIYVLVLPVGERGEHTWRLRGWLWGHEAQEHWLRRHGGREEAYFCPQTALHDMDTYPDRLHDQGVGVDERVAEYLADCAAAPWLERKYHPTAAGAVKLIYHRGPGEAAAIKAAFEAQS